MKCPFCGREIPEKMIQRRVMSKLGSASGSVKKRGNADYYRKLQRRRERLRVFKKSLAKNRKGA